VPAANPQQINTPKANSNGLWSTLCLNINMISPFGSEAAIEPVVHTTILMMIVMRTCGRGSIARNSGIEGSFTIAPGANVIKPLKTSRATRYR
ncbi:MAG: hypothetical protein PVF33_08430, partial [Candidatus Latescibacterota bacterium]